MRHNGCDRGRAHRGRGLAVLLGVCTIALGSCTGTTEGTVSDASALGVGGVVGAATGNPLLGVAAGLGARYGLDEAYRYGERRFYGNAQDEIAHAGGRADIGEVVPWTYEGPLDIGDARGRVEAVRGFGTSLRCRLIIFTVEPLGRPPLAGGEGRSRPVEPVDTASDLPDGTNVFTTTICRTPDGWEWAESRPSTARWGGLQ